MSSAIYAPDPVLIVVRRARALRRAGSLAEAARLLGAAAQAADSAAGRVSAYLEWGKVLDLQRRRRSAQSCYRRVLALTDDWSDRDQARRLFRKPYRG